MKYLAIALGLTVAACAAVSQKVQTFEARAEPVIASACAEFRQAEANPLVGLAVAGGTMALNVATGGTGGAVVASLKGFGDAFCTAGPPLGDTTSPAQQAAWLLNTVAGPMLSAAKP